MSGSAAAEDQSSVKSEDSLPGGRAKFLCSYGGRIMPRPHDSQLRYVGGETRILSVPRGVSFPELMSKLRRLCPFPGAVLKYQLPDEDLDALVSVISEEDMENMMEEYERVEAKDSNSRLRLFLFTAVLAKPEIGSGDSSSFDNKFVDALNGVVYRKAQELLPPSLEEQRLKNMVMFPVQQQQQPPSVISEVPLVQAMPPVQPLAVAPGQSHVVQPPVAPMFSPLPPVIHPGLPSYLPVNNVVPMVNHPKAPTPTPPPPPPSYVRVPAGAQFAPQVLPARYVVSQVQAAVVAPQPRPVTPSSTYLPLVGGALPKGVVLRQFSLEDDRSESPSSQGSQMNDDRRESGEMMSEFDKLRVQENVILQHFSDGKMKPNQYQVVAGQPMEGGPQVVYIPSGEFGAHRKVYEQGDVFGIARATSAPVMKLVDVPGVTPAVQPFQRQLSDRSEPQLVHQENCLPNVRAGIGGEPVLVPLDDRFTSPVLHPLNGLRPQQLFSEQPVSHMDTSQLLQKPVKVVPQVVAVNPYKVP